MSDVWTDTRVDALRRLWADGRSISQIAAALGCGLTRSAVIGKVHRLGLCGRRASSPRHGHIRVGKNGQHSIVRPTRKSSYRGEVQIVTDRQLPRELPATDIPVEQRKTLLELELHHCRFPYGNPGETGFFFCGADKQWEQPYCTAHCRIAFNGFGAQRV